MQSGRLNLVPLPFEGNPVRYSTLILPLVALFPTACTLAPGSLAGDEQAVLFVQVLSPTVAVATLRGSSTEANALFWTEVLQKSEDGRWLITYEHESWPDCSTPRGPHIGTEGMGEME
jgi:hypothetical protein